jgi:flagellar P-ring protein precursor FlgI
MMTKPLRKELHRQLLSSANWPCSRVVLCPLVFTAMILAICPTTSGGVRIKDIATVEGDRVNVIQGIGLVVGLNGSGGKSPATREFLANYLARMGNRMDAISRLQLQRGGSVSAVQVSARLPVFSRPGTTVDVDVSALDGAKSLQGGRLIATDMLGPDGKIYARASGWVSLGGGFSASGNAATATKNHTTAGKIENGAIIEDSVHFRKLDPTRFDLYLRRRDFSTAARVAKAINDQVPRTAIAIDPATITVLIPKEYQYNPIPYISLIEEITVIPDSVASVVINERTGTIVIGRGVQISQVAVTHANLFITTNEAPVVSQPAPFSRGETEVVPRTTLDVAEETSPVRVLTQTVTIGDLADALNALGANARDLIPILQQIKRSGGLHAELIFN